MSDTHMNRQLMDQVEFLLRQVRSKILECDDVWKSDERGQIMVSAMKGLHLAEKWNKRYREWQKPYRDYRGLSNNAETKP